MVDEVLRAPRDARDVAQPQARQLQAEVERVGLDAASRAADALLVLVLDALALSSGDQLELLLEPRRDLRDGRLAAAVCGPPAARATAPPRRPVRRAPRARTPRRPRAAPARRRAPARAPARRRRAPAARTPPPARAAIPRRPSRSASSPGGSASKRTSWQRERIVGSTSPRRSVSRIRWTNGAGSSSVFSSLFAACSISASALLEHEHAPRRFERRHRGRRDDRLLDVADEHLVRAARHDPRQVGMRAVLDARAHAGRVGRALRQQRRRERARRGALAAAGRAVEEVGVRGRGRPAASAAPSVARACGWCSVPGRSAIGDEGTGGATPVSSPAAMRGRLITIEGLDGAGKTTLARGLARRAPRARDRRRAAARARRRRRRPSASARS